MLQNMRAMSLKECYLKKSRKGTRKPSLSIAKQNSDHGGTTKNHEKSKRRNSMERKHQKAAFTWLSLQYPAVRAVTFHPANGGSRNIIEARNLKAEGVTAGVPDMVCLYPSRNYHGFVCEFKFGSNTLTRAQSEYIKNLTELGFYCCVCYTWFEFMGHFLYYIGKNADIL